MGYGEAGEGESVLFEVREGDRTFYDERLADFLPTRMIDVHTHVWLKAHAPDAPSSTRTATWPSRVAEENPIEDLLETYRLLFPRQEVIPLIFGSPREGTLFDAANGFRGSIAGVHEVLRRQGLLEGRWLLDPEEDLGPGQMDEIDRVYRAYPHLNDDEFVREHLDEWLAD